MAVLADRASDVLRCLGLESGHGNIDGGLRGLALLSGRRLGLVARTPKQERPQAKEGDPSGTR